MNKAIFLDRDNTIIKDVPYNGDPAKVELVPGVTEALTILQKNGYLLIIISNQSGVGRGMITKEQVRLVNDEMIRKLGKNYFTDIFICCDDPERPVENCRKPSPEMIFRARDKYDIDLSRSFFIGDKEEDVQAGHNAGCTSIRFLYNDNNKGIGKYNIKPGFASGDWRIIAEWICSK
ncbi:MAG TPA: HAD family hydrolase [bacterium]|nr:HAD family hydrolase [bacterium]HPN45384.1 HAD family hydrolase [bacterium]